MCNTSGMPAGGRAIFSRWRLVGSPRSSATVGVCMPARAAIISRALSPRPDGRLISPATASPTAAAGGLRSGFGANKAVADAST